LIIKEKVVTGNNPQVDTGTDQPAVLCEVCGSVMVEEDGEMICPHCDASIDYFGEEDESDTK
jgi:uncharacterized Zn finger protein (UPF0148 family)